MSHSHDIKFIERASLDIQKWDRCIETSPNGRLYAASFYLDYMALHWDALVLGDYEAVMPLTWNKKYGIRYLFQPFLTAQLGVFGKSLDSNVVASFITAIPREFRYADISLNAGNLFESMPGVTTRNNYVLPLDKPHTELFQSYKETTQRNIKKAAQSGCEVMRDIDVEQVIRLALHQMRAHGGESKDNTNRFRRLYQYLYERKMAIAYGVSFQEQIVASCVFFLFQQRAYYILVGNHPNGKTIGASHTLIDAFIKDHAGSGMVLDFEGSDIRNLAFFYSSFGAVNEPYPALKWNRLPFFLRWLKQ